MILIFQIVIIWFQLSQNNIVISGESLWIYIFDRTDVLILNSCIYIFLNRIQIFKEIIWVNFLFLFFIFRLQIIFPNKNLRCVVLCSWFGIVIICFYLIIFIKLIESLEKIFSSNLLLRSSKQGRRLFFRFWSKYIMMEMVAIIGSWNGMHTIF